MHLGKLFIGQCQICMKPAVIFVTFESEFSGYGGLGTVMKVLPKEMGDPEHCFVMAPFFKRIIDLAGLKKGKKIQEYATVLSFYLVIRGQVYPVEVLEVVNLSGMKTFLLSSDQFFNAPDNPYVNPCNSEIPLDPYRNPINPEKLTEDSLFFSIAVPTVLVELCKDGVIPVRDLILHLQDWETAAVAQAFKVEQTRPAIHSTKCVLTIHNPYDKPLHDMNSPLVLDFAGYLGFKKYGSILEQVIPILDGPVSTVSRNFAYELRNEVLYTQIFCSHLQKAFKKKTLVGVDNGIFGKATFPFSKAALRDAKKGEFQQIQQEKWERRKNVANVMSEYQQKLPKKTKLEIWGADIDLSNPEIPIFFVLGRDDPRQKGFDVIVEAINSLPEGQSRFIFTPMPGDEGFIGLKFLEDLARKRPGEVQVFPFRLQQSVFTALQKGSSFMVMGSLYEPFGAANEAYLAGMPVVARTTGGLVQQIVPHPQCLQSERILGLYGRQLVKRYHHPDAAPTGILFREQVSFVEEVEGWRKIVDCGYWYQNPKGDRITDRKNLILFQAMVKSAANALQFAIDLYKDQGQYAEMIYNGWNMLDKFTWKRAISGYQNNLYRM